MIVPFLFSYVTSEPMRDLWAFGEMLAVARKNKFPLIAKEEYFDAVSSKDFFDETTKYKEFRYIYNNVDEIEHYAFPKKIEEGLIEEHNDSINDMFLYLLSERCEVFEDWFNSVIDEIEKKNNDEISAFFSVPSSQIFSFRKVASERGIKIICFDVGLFRMPVYTNTMYWSLSRLGSADSEKDIAERFGNFSAEVQKTKLLTKRQILALFLKEDYFKYLDSSDDPPEFEIGVACSYGYYAPYLSETHYNDEELLYRTNRVYKQNEITVRLHPNDPAKSAYPFLIDNYDNSSNSTEFVLKCKRVASIASNVSIEAAYWGRASYVLKASHVRYKAIKDLRQKTEGVIDDKYLNFYAFCVLTPFEFLRDIDYINWWLSEPTEMEIYNRHFEYYLEKQGLKRNLFNFEDKEGISIIRDMRVNKKTK
ncbi:hypothetical protein FACS1894188_13240 [Clostridia bacterium]|nr:hypothetical protein FACS1894188_13240 [Clostridia bacterium]